MTDQKLMDFDALYQGQSVTFGGGDQRLDTIPWRLDGPQPVIVELADAGEFTGPILESGCGLGDNALFLAERGYEITAFDAAPTVIEQDRAKAAERGLKVDFTVADATTLDGIEGGFNTALDSAMMHCLTDEQRRAYLAALHGVCNPGAKLHILCFPDIAEALFPMPGHTDEASLRRDIGQHWRVDRMRMRGYSTSFTREQWAAVMPPAAAAFLPDPGSADGVDDQGRVLLPVWQIRAVRD
ncbi:class I SAM-dependent methyltransferase [Kutzneria kofuensis]|uniref:SAM-dependent methyltransferase n=1 Tax=Kutzneria kofuensis TaxID=103725 RepID=A0A7W9NM72_9PSEU|nr:class I SAM-dependent methyltransferase [Kutzneria kofuensis]MBB5897038.1 SAM-dependent methyltransferase [Kutzneria kofuensis]